MKKTFIYRLVVTNNNIIIKRFLGNDKNELHERFEMWLIKQGYDRADIDTYIEYVQHANNRY